MTNKEKKKTIKSLIMVLVTIIILGAIVSVILYLKTDMLKSNKTLFMKYAFNGIKNIEENTSIIKISGNEKEDKYKANTKIDFNYIEGIGTTSENKDNIINNLEIIVDENVDESNNYDYKNIKLLKENQEIKKVEYLKNEEKVGVRVLDFSKFFYINETNFNEFANKMGIPEQITAISEFSANEIEMLKLTQEEINALQNKYIGLIDKKFDNNNFKKEKNKTIIIDESKILVNEYSLAISKEKMNNLYIDILNTMKNDEIILKKIDEIQSIVDKFDFISEEKISLKDEFNQNIEDLIEEINKNNIGSEEICISIYEYKGETIGISIPLMDKQIDLKCYTKDGYSNSEISITSQNNILRQIALKGNEKETIVYIEDNEKNKPTKLEIKNIKDTNNNTTIVYEIEKAKLEINLNRFVEAVDDITDKIKFNSDNSGQIDTLDDERFNQLNELLKNEFDKQYTELKGVIDITDLENILYKIGLSKEATILEMSGDITETQKNRFNSKFEFLQGMELNGERILQEIEIFKENIRDFHVISNDVMEIEVDRISGENEKIIHLQDFIGKDRNRKYNLELKYDEETGLVKFIVMTIVRKK